jgi:hypothetical protein
MDRFVLGEELISTQRGHAQITNGTVLIPLPRSRKRGSHLWTSDAANHAQQQDAVRPAAEILGRAGGRLCRICTTTGSDGGAQLRPSAPPTPRCSAGGTAPHRARSGTSAAAQNTGENGCGGGTCVSGVVWRRRHGPAAAGKVLAEKNRGIGIFTHERSVWLVFFLFDVVQRFSPTFLHTNATGPNLIVKNENNEAQI